MQPVPKEQMQSSQVRRIASVRCTFNCTAMRHQIEASHLDLYPGRPPGQTTAHFNRNQVIRNNEFYFIGGTGRELPDLGNKLTGYRFPGPDLWPPVPSVEAAPNLEKSISLQRKVNIQSLAGATLIEQRATPQQSAFWDFLSVAQHLIPIVPLLMAVI